MAGQIKIRGQLWSGQVAMTQGRVAIAAGFSPQRGDMSELVPARATRAQMYPAHLPGEAVALIPVITHGREPLMDSKPMAVIISN